jgi:hypothetical protein
VNATEGGSHIQQFAEKTLREVLDELPELGITSDQMAQMARERNPPVTRSEVRRWALHQAELTQEVKRAATKLHQAARSTRVGLVKTDPRAHTTAFKKLEKLEKRMREACAAQPLLEGWAYGAIHRITSESKRDGAQADAEADAAKGLDRESEIARVLRDAAVELHERLTALARRFETKSGPTQSGNRLQ